MTRSTLCAATLLLASTASAQEPAQPMPSSSPPDRVLGGRVFPTPAFMPSPFVTTHVAFLQGVTYLSIPDFPIEPGRTRDASVLGLTDRLEAGFHFAKFFELFGFGASEILTGTDVRSALISGASFAYSAGAGGRVRLFRSDPSGTEISLHGEVSYGTGGLLDLLRLADAVATQPPATGESIVTGNLGRLVLTDTSQTTAAGHLLVAQRLVQNVGLQAALGARWNSVKAEFYDLAADRRISSDDSSVSPDMSVTLDADLAPHVPLGFLLEYSLRDQKQPIAGHDEAAWGGLSHLVALGVHLINPTLQLGLTVGRVFGLDPVQRLDPRGRRLESGTPYLSYGQLFMSFTW